MKKIGISIVITLMALSFGCSSMEDKKPYYEFAANNSFESIFPSHTATKTFNSVDDAFVYVNAAGIKLTKSVNKVLNFNRVYLLEGPDYAGADPKSMDKVSVNYWITAQNIAGYINLSDAKEDLKTKLMKTTMITLNYFIFYGGKKMLIQSVYIHQGYSVKPGSPMKTVTFEKNKYKAAYKTGWGLNKAREHMQGETE